MNWKEYLPLAEKTLSSQFNGEDVTIQKLLHAVIGSLTEIEELLENYENGILLKSVNKQGSVAEEAGDVYWYLSILFRELNITAELTQDSSFIIDKFNVSSPFDILIKFTQINLKFLDILKKKIYYNKPMEQENMITLSNDMFHLMNYYCQVYNTSVADILEKNIEKLRARYSDKFTSERAINRDLETERIILETKK